MIDELIANGQYKDALESLTDLEDEQVRYYRLICLYGLGQYQQGLEEAREAKALAKDTYYDVVCYYIDFLKECSFFDEAIDAVVAELEMPYIPYQYDSKLNVVYDELILLKQEANAVYEGKKTIFSEDELAMYLNKGLDAEIAMMAIEQLASSNIRRFMPEVRAFLKNEERSSLEKSLILEILKEQEVDEELEITKRGMHMEVSPIYLETVFQSNAYEQTGLLLEREIEDENPSLFNMCIEFLEYYLYDLYPMLEMIENEGALAAAVHYYVSSLSLIDCDMEDLCYSYGCDEEEINEYLEQFSQMATI